MTSEQALEVLELSPNPDMEQVRQRYRELYSEYRMRLTNAPMSSLKQVYQQNLEEIREACEVLQPGLLDDETLWLPGSGPSMGGTDEDVRELLETADRQVSDGHYPQAIEAFQSVLTTNPGNSAALAGLEQAQRKLKTSQEDAERVRRKKTFARYLRTTLFTATAITCGWTTQLSAANLSFWLRNSDLNSVYCLCGMFLGGFEGLALRNTPLSFQLRLWCAFGWLAGWIIAARREPIDMLVGLAASGSFAAFLLWRSASTQKV